MINRYHLVLAVALAGSLAACSDARFDMPSRITPTRAELVTQDHEHQFLTKQIGGTEFSDIAKQFERYGTGELEVIVSYDPHSKKNTARKASSELERIVGNLRSHGVDSIASSIMPLENSGDDSQTVIGYRTVTAQAPANCYDMPGYDNSQARADWDYELGCSVESQIARQIARPKDLAGRAGMDQGDGRRQVAIVDAYRSGQPYPGLSNTESASGN